MNFDRLKQDAQRFVFAAVAIVVTLVATGALEKANELLISVTEYRAYVADSCEPKHRGQMAMSRINEAGKLRCTIYENVGYGTVPRQVSDVAMARPL